MNRPDHVKCIAHTHLELARRTWCGRAMDAFEFCFQGVDHAAENGRQNGYLVACTACVDAALDALRTSAG